VINFLKEVRLEISKVIWPKKKEVVKLTVTVLLISLIVAAYLGLLDFGFTKMIEGLIAG